MGPPEARAAAAAGRSRRGPRPSWRFASRGSYRRRGFSVSQASWASWASWALPRIRSQSHTDGRRRLRGSSWCPCRDRRQPSAGATGALRARRVALRLRPLATSRRSFRLRPSPRTARQGVDRRCGPCPPSLVGLVTRNSRPGHSWTRAHDRRCGRLSPLDFSSANARP